MTTDKEVPENNQEVVAKLQNDFEPVSRQKNVGLELTHMLRQSRATANDWEETPSYSLTGFSVDSPEGKSKWRVFGQATKDEVNPPRIRLIVAEDKGEKWFNPENRHTTVERLDDGQRLISNPELLASLGKEVTALIGAMGASASFSLNRGFTIGKSLSHTKTRRLGEDVSGGFVEKFVTDARGAKDETPGRG